MGVTKGDEPVTTHDSAAFLADFAEMSAFGATPGGGVERQAASVADGELRTWFAAWLTDRGFEVRRDGIGNIFGLLELVPGAPYVMMGSHLDSQPMAGKYDGAYGVLAAAHAAQRLAERHRAAGTVPRYNLAVVDWFNEEGSRFKPSMMGSSVYTGKLALERALATADRSGTTVAQALDAIDGRGEAADIPVAGYAEIHIEQGKLLEEVGATIGVVDSTWCAYKYEVVVHGEQAHTGSTRMADRRDALLAASMLVVAVRELTDQFEVEELHTSVGELDVLPNSPVAIAREVNLLVDLRAPATPILHRAFELLTDQIADIEKRTGCEIQVVSRSIWESGPFAAESIALVEAAAESTGHTHHRLMTLAGHDATNMKDIVPTVLVFVPSVDGLSHNEREYTTDDDLVAGMDVFAEVVARMADGALDAAAS
jgi:N-carbamoyl-L-amino-acid hydrolase